MSKDKHSFIACLYQYELRFPSNTKHFRARVHFVDLINMALHGVPNFSKHSKIWCSHDGKIATQMWPGKAYVIEEITKLTQQHNVKWLNKCNFYFCSSKSNGMFMGIQVFLNSSNGLASS